MSTLPALSLILGFGLSFLFGFLLCWLLLRHRNRGAVERPAGPESAAHAERALRESEALLQRAQRIAKLAHWVWRPDAGSRDWRGGMSEYSAAAADIFGVAPSALAVPNRVFLERFVHPDDHGAVGIAYAGMFEPGGADYEIEYRILRADGEIRTIHEIAEHIYADDGTLLYSVGTLQDVTERARAEAALRESQSLLRAVVDTAPATINVKDRDGRYVLVNAYQAKYHGRPVDWFPGRSPRDIYDPAYAARLREFDLKIIETGTALDFHELDYTTPDGRETKWLMSRAPIRDTAGKVSHVVSVGLDITERHRAEAARRASEAHKAVVLESALDSVIVIDDEGRILEFNPAAERMFGRRRADVLGREMADVIIPPQYRAPHRAGLARLRAGGPSTILGRRLELSALRADGEEFPVELAINASVSGGRTVFTGYLRDITERKRAEEALRESEALLRRAQRMAKLGHWISTTKSAPGTLPVMVTRYATGAAEILGVPLAELEISDRSFIERFIHPDDRVAALANYEGYLRQIADLPRTGAPPADYGGGYRIVRPDGEIRYLSETVESAFAEDGALRYTMGTIQDITELKVAEAQLAESRALLRETIDSVPATIAVRDLEGRYVLVNAALAKYHDRPIDWFPGHTAAELYDEAYVRHVRDSDRQVIELGERRDFRESDYREHNGRVSTWLASRAPIRDAVGQVKYVVSVGLDITERKQAEAALRESESRFRMIADSIPALIWMCDEKGQCIFLNKQWSAYTGRPVAEELGRGFVDSVHPDDRAHAQEVEQAILARRVHFTDEYRLRGADGKYRWFLDTMVPRVAADGVYLGHVGVLIDIDDRRALEEQLRQIQRLEAVGQMTGGIAHDFNNLLTVVIGNLDLIRDYPDNAKSVASLAGLALQAAQRGAELVHRMVAFSRQQMLKPRKIELNRLVDGTGDMLRRSLSANIEIEMRLADGLWTARADPGQVEDSLLNLALNSRDAMPAGGRLTIETANVVLDADGAAHDSEMSPGDYVMLSVSDTGVGMTPEVLARAVQPFFTTKEVGRGSGLGLSMVYGFAKQSGGHMKIASEAGRGCTVKLYLPRFIGDADPATDATRTGLVGGSERILVVEDDEMVRSYVAGQLRSLGYDIVEASDGAAALTLIAAGRRFDLVFTDVMLPGGLLGPQLLAQARAQVPGLKALFTSGYSEAAVLPAHLDGTVRLLQKPYSRHSLASHVRAALDAAAG